jgi:hypothetical protein
VKPTPATRTKKTFGGFPPYSGFMVFQATFPIFQDIMTHGSRAWWQGVEVRRFLGLVVAADNDRFNGTLLFRNHSSFLYLVVAIICQVEFSESRHCRAVHQEGVRFQA